ncbi:hypothetical protein G6O69_38585 [Pseudenhygromyxa sp. WMMC2535]|uniref:hypothetical protein n=1 Tax=Pseudenhygromyxa sp. WMMC2535 TaxID=2712867 RepID=UPI0015950A26|nr:hypothetical protein [Pseudenhygromyxa sp. WMMC2535]
MRFRLSFAQGGSRRAVVWSIAQALDARQAALRNDSRAVSWTIEVDEARSQLVALPRRPDPRFDYRVAHLPASSHPTLAAIMARVAAPQPGERVWDPFCGCAAELIECSRLADALRLIGTDRDPRRSRRPGPTWRPRASTPRACASKRSTSTPAARPRRT